MRRYIEYLKYVLRHKWYVAQECLHEGMYWRAFVHDMSKFSPSEFIPYAKHFHNPDGSSTVIRDKTGYYKPTDTGDEKFDFAWLLHQKRNRHHWQWWALPGDDGVIKVLEMGKNDVKEMICDWVGAGKAQGYVSPKDNRYLETRNWYVKNKDKMILHQDTRRYIENVIFFGYRIELEDNDNWALLEISNIVNKWYGIPVSHPSNAQAACIAVVHIRDILKEVDSIEDVIGEKG